MANPVTVHDKGFTVLYEAPCPKVDIVFVHGFTGHPRDTWTLKATGTQSKSRSKKHGHEDDEGYTDGGRRSKIPKLQLFGRRQSNTVSTASSSTQPSRVPTGEDAVRHTEPEYKEQLQIDVFWPADLACKTTPDSRILTYGYDTKIRHLLRGPVSKKSVYDHGWDLLCCLEARRRNPDEKCRPVVFVAHSLGGIVVKEALRRSRGCESSKPHLHGICESTVGILFFGTPHGGSDPRGFFHHVLAASAQALGVQVNKQIVGTLLPGAERLSELRDEFSVIWQQKKWPVYSFQEEYGVTALFGKKVVDDQSSCLNNFLLETKQFISSNHMDMCRFSGLEDPEYSKVAAAMDHITGALGRTTDPISPVHPFARSQSQGTYHSADEESGPTTAGPENTRHLEGKASLRNEYHGLPGETRQALIDQLYFTKIDERLTSLAAAQGSTCRWFLSTSEYTDWRDANKQPDHGGFLWIWGNPGTGKSTLMKLLFEEAKLSSKSDSSKLTLSFFFLARGVLEEKSTFGLYRSLLHQLFEKAPDLQNSLEWLTLDGARGIQANGWHEQALKQTFGSAIRKLGERSLTIFVDALDECDDAQAKEMVCFFEELCAVAQDEQVLLNICFSSRHYPYIEIKKGIKVVLEDEGGHKEDIEQYIQVKLRLRKSKTAQSLQLELLEKSQLIFLWVVLVVEILNHDYPSKPIEKMRKRLREIPQKLGELFEMILTRDRKHPELLHICLKLILFANRPLKPQELYFAVQFGLGEEESCSGFWDQEVMDLDDMKTFAREWSKGLAEVTKASEVQFIHESVRGFLLDRYSGQRPEDPGSFAGHCHRLLRDCCLAQLNDAVSQCGILNVSPLPITAQGEAVTFKFPFLDYSVSNVLRHANSAQQCGMEQTGFLDGFPLQQWAALSNLLERHAVRKYGDSVGLLYILAEKGLDDLIKAYPIKDSCFDVVPETRYGPPILAAMAAGGDETAMALLEAEVRDHPNRSQLLELCQQYRRKKAKLPKLGFRFVFSENTGVLGHLADQGNEVALDFLLSRAAVDVNARRSRSLKAPLSRAAEKGHEAAVKLLLEKGAEVDSMDSKGTTPLSYAAQGGHEAVVYMLLEKGPSINLPDKSGMTPLLYAAGSGHEAVMRSLLEKGAEVDPKDNRGRTPLWHAAYRGHEAVVRSLLDKGAEVNTKDYKGRTPLWYAARRGYEAVVRSLLEKGAEVDLKDNGGRTPLSCTAEWGYEAVVRSLLEKGAKVDSKDKKGRTPLSYTAGHPSVGYERASFAAVVRLLLEKGAGVDTADREGRTPLSYAVETRYNAVTIKLLLRKGAKPEAKDILGETPLSRAWRSGTWAIVRL